MRRTRTMIVVLGLVALVATAIHTRFETIAAWRQRGWPVPYVDPACREASRGASRVRERVPLAAAPSHAARGTYLEAVGPLALTRDCATSHKDVNLELVDVARPGEENIAKRAVRLGFMRLVPQRLSTDGTAERWAQCDVVHRNPTIVIHRTDNEISLFGHRFAVDLYGLFAARNLLQRQWGVRPDEVDVVYADCHGSGLPSITEAINTFGFRSVIYSPTPSVGPLLCFDDAFILGSIWQFKGTETADTRTFVEDGFWREPEMFQDVDPLLMDLVGLLRAHADLNAGPSYAPLKPIRVLVASRAAELRAGSALSMPDKRLLANEAELTAALSALRVPRQANWGDRRSELSQVDVEVVEFSALSLTEAVRKLDSAAAFVGLHGSAFWNVPFLPRGAVVLEVRGYGSAHSPSYNTLARASGKMYLKYVNPEPARERCGLNAMRACHAHDADMMVDAFAVADLLKAGLVVQSNVLSRFQFEYDSKAAWAIHKEATKALVAAHEAGTTFADGDTTFRWPDRRRDYASVPSDEWDLLRLVTGERGKRALDASVLHEGALGTLAAFAAAAEKGASLTVGFLGGSQSTGGGVGTMRDAFTLVFLRLLQRRFPRAKLDYVNMAQGGAGFTYPAMCFNTLLAEQRRADKDKILVDLWVLDYSVNFEWEQPALYEALLAHLAWRSSSRLPGGHPAVISTIVAMRGAFAGSKLEHTRAQAYAEVAVAGARVGVPVVSFFHAVGAALDLSDGQAREQLLFACYAEDDHHYGAYGHAVMAVYMDHLVGRAHATVTDVAGSYFGVAVARPNPRLTERQWAMWDESSEWSAPTLLQRMQNASCQSVLFGSASSRLSPSAVDGWELWTGSRIGKRPDRKAAWKPTRAGATMDTLVTSGGRAKSVCALVWALPGQRLEVSLIASSGQKLGDSTLLAPPLKQQAAADVGNRTTYQMWCDHSGVLEASADVRSVRWLSPTKDSPQIAGVVVL